MPKGKCAVIDCTDQASRREWCNKHYQRWAARQKAGWPEPIDPSLPMPMGPRHRVHGPRPKTMGSEKRNRILVRLFKAGKPCLDCNNHYPPECMDFDHRPGEDKLFCIARAACTVDRLIAEIAKCDLICANCHRIRTYARIQEARDE